MVLVVQYSSTQSYSKYIVVLVVLVPILAIIPVAPVVLVLSGSPNCGLRCAFWRSNCAFCCGPNCTYGKLIRYEPIPSKMPGPFSGIFLVVCFYHTTCTDWVLNCYRGAGQNYDNHHCHHNVAVVVLLLHCNHGDLRDFCVTLPERSAPASATGSQPWSGHQLPGEGTHGLENIKSETKETRQHTATW